MKATPGKLAADRAVNFINALSHTKGQRWAGNSFNLRPWQENKIIRPLFGTLRPDGLRQYRTCFTMLPRKNGKSELAAAIALYFLLGENEPGGEIYSAAADRDQASLVFNVAAQMVRNDPELDAACKIIDSQKRIVNFKTGSFYRAISSEAHTKHGFNASVVIYDEVHAAPNRELWTVLTSSMGARDQPLTFAITTAGFDKHSLERELFDYSLRVLGGLDDPTFLPVLYYAPDDADWKDEAVWHAANPALGDFRSIEEMRVFCKQAQEMPAMENEFRRLYLCQHTEQDVRFIPMDKWKACGEAFDQGELDGQECFAGLDLSTTTDISAFVLYFPDSQCVLPFFWIPEEGITRREKKDRVPYRQWVRDGLMTACPGDTIDYDQIRLDINEISQRFRITKLARDRWNATQITTQLMGDGLNVVDFGQGYASMTAPTKELERQILDEEIRHGNNAVLNWMAGNVSAEMDAAGNIKPSKAKSTDRIAGIMALIMAMGTAALEPEGAAWGIIR